MGEENQKTLGGWTFLTVTKKHERSVKSLLRKHLFVGPFIPSSGAARQGDPSPMTRLVAHWPQEILN